MTNKTDSTHGKSTVSETVEKFSFGSGRAYADNSEYASKGLRFDILEIKFEPGRGYEGHDRWVVKVKVADREPEQLSLGSNPGPRRATSRCSSPSRARWHNRKRAAASIR